MFHSGLKGELRFINRSVMINRMFVLLMLAIILSGVLTSLFYTWTSSLVNTRKSSHQFISRASYLANCSARYLTYDLSYASFMGILNASPELLDATVVISLNNGESFTETEEKEPLDDDILAQIQLLRMQYRNNPPHAPYELTQVYLGHKSIEHLLVICPITMQSLSGITINGGFVMIIKPMSEISAGDSSLRFAVIFASCFAFVLILIPSILGINRLLRPLRQVQKVAIALSNGNYSVRADDTQKGEFGDLAVSINTLASTLDNTISENLFERNRLHQILDGITEGILATDNRLVPTHFNPALYNLFLKALPNRSGTLSYLSPDLARSEDDSDNLIEYILHDSPYGPGILEDFRRAILKHEIVRRNIQIADRVVLLAVSPLIGNMDQVYGAVGLFRDVTAAEKLEQTRRDYVANISHELRTPLTALRGLMEPLNDGLVTDDEDRKRYYKIILDETLRLSRLIDDMLELSRLQAGQLTLKKYPFNLNEVFDNIHDKYELLAGEKEIRLSFPAAEELPLAYGNADRCEQILVILLDNALKFTPRGGQIQLRVLDSDKKLEVSVQNTGSGINQEDIDHICERFYKADKSRGRSGTGLGLSIAQEILRAMGETIYVDSKPGEGARFTFTVTKAESDSKTD